MQTRAVMTRLEHVYRVLGGMGLEDSIVYETTLFNDDIKLATYTKVDGEVITGVGMDRYLTPERAEVAGYVADVEPTGDIVSISLDTHHDNPFSRTFVATRINTDYDSDCPLSKIDDQIERAVCVLKTAKYLTSEDALKKINLPTDEGRLFTKVENGIEFGFDYIKGSTAVIKGNPDILCLSALLGDPDNKSEFILQMGFANPTAAGIVLDYQKDRFARLTNEFAA
jgi:hypothetical protein